ncbi:MAG: flagellar hook-basal body protein [Proteobacteria bacterium]|nr:flagellar hook-basal body protein [Pseudomonadota bacterium]
MILEMTRPVQAGLRQEKKYEVTANHIANVDTTGFKKDTLSFDRMMKANLSVDLTQGDVISTQNKLDVALMDEGFFKVQTVSGVRYTRNGNFHLDNLGRIVTPLGDPVLGDAGPLTVQGTNIYINSSGGVEVDGGNIGNLSVVTFADLGKIQKEGSGYFIYKGGPQDEIPPQKITMKQGTLERSNVSTVYEMTKMIDIQRMYEAAQKMMQTFDEVDGRAINDVGKLA